MTIAVGDEKRSRKENDNDDSDYPGRTPHFIKDVDEIMPIVWGYEGNH
ncbi:MAG: hypothetical protein Q4Q14_08900 [Methanobrevibacter sp.]|nr:hypothetical protein [Methanobrevibacter sp.]